MQAYSDPKRESGPFSLPDVEVWRDRVTEITCSCGVYGVPYDSAHATSETYCPSCGRPAESVEDTARKAWWWCSCFPGCLPDSDTFGPFATQAEALADAQEGNSDDEDDGLPLPTKPIPFGTDGCLSRDSDGTWPSRADGGYPIVYYFGDGEECCPACANGAEGSEAHESAEASQWRIAGSDIYWEGPPLECAHCGAAIESAYGDPDDEPDDDESDDPS